MSPKAVEYSESARNVVDDCDKGEGPSVRCHGCCYCLGVSALIYECFVCLENIGEAVIVKASFGETKLQLTQSPYDPREPYSAPRH